MEHLEFINELDKLGVSLRSTNIAGKTKEFEIGDLLGNRIIESKDLQLKWKDEKYYHESPLKALCKKAIDLDTWKHSWHMQIEPENYKRIEEIIQEKIIKRAKEIDELMSIYFHLRYEMSNKT
jgi:hypothetical protein